MQLLACATLGLRFRVSILFVDYVLYFDELTTNYTFKTRCTIQLIDDQYYLCFVVFIFQRCNLSIYLPTAYSICTFNKYYHCWFAYGLRMGLIREITLSQRVELTEMASRDPLTKLYNRRFAKN